MMIEKKVTEDSVAELGSTSLFSRTLHSLAIGSYEYMDVVNLFPRSLADSFVCELSTVVVSPGWGPSAASTGIIHDASLNWGSLYIATAVNV